MSLYKTLGVRKNASLKSIKLAYKKLASKYHPDKDGGDEEKFKEIKTAYETLSNKEKRNAYDLTGQTKQPDYKKLGKEMLEQYIQTSLESCDLSLIHI